MTARRPSPRRPSPSMNKGATMLIDKKRQKSVKRGERWRWVPLTELKKRSPARSTSGRSRDSFWNKHCKGKEGEDCEMHTGSRSRVPNYCANQCKGERRKKFGVEYESTQNDNGSWYWKRVDEDDMTYSTNDDTYDSSTSSKNARSVSSFPRQIVSPGKVSVSVSMDVGSKTPSSVKLEKGTQSIAFKTKSGDTKIIQDSYEHFERPNTHVFAFWNENEKEIDLYMISVQPVSSSNFRGYLISSYSLGTKVSESDMTVQTMKVDDDKELKITTSANGTETMYKYDPRTRSLFTDADPPQKLKLKSHTFKSLFDAGEDD